MSDGDPTEPVTGDEPEAGPAGEPAATPAARPAWSYFVMPSAIFLAGLAVALAIVWVWRDDGDDGGAAATESQSTGQLLSAFAGYAGDVGVDEAEFRECLATQSTADIINEHLQQGFALGVNGTPTFFINDKVLIGAQPMAIMDEIIDRELAGDADAVEDYSAAVQQLAAAGRFRIAEAQPVVEGAALKGTPGAPVVVAEFSDFQCPFCKRWVEDGYAALGARLGDDVALAFLHFPIIQIHPNAGNASAAAVCAGQQGRFWEMHDLLFERQAEWQGLR